MANYVHSAKNGMARPQTDDGVEPDARFTFANERTFLAWSRTALALIGLGATRISLEP